MTRCRQPKEPPVASEAATSGIDVTLIDETLAMTPEERLRMHDAALRCVITLRLAMGVPADDFAS